FMELLRDISTLLDKERVAGIAVIFFGSEGPLFFPPYDVLDIIIVCPVSYPAIRDQAFVLDEEEVIHFKFSEEVAMDDIVVKVEHYPLNYRFPAILLSMPQRAFVLYGKMKLLLP